MRPSGTSAGYLVAVSGRSSVVTVRGNGFLNDNSCTGFSITNTPTIHVQFDDWPCDVSTLARSSGDGANTTNG
jgi:hypothetical protein